ncbi:MAG TPA: hypothetical protein DCL15_12540 [Chloroflexi bacterium]|nr:hypothetical protein [Chloroflexota bacterium]HHW84786.1 hypothetical protein [Chloroflexota bacterium]
MAPPTTTHMSLTDWEKTLSAYCKRVSHLSEIPLSAFDIDEIGRHLKALVSRTQKNQLKDQISRYPSIWVVYMAAIAARNDDLGYWEALIASLGASRKGLPASLIGSAFLNAVKQLGLPDYADVGGYHYVTPIRLHGGIPAYSLPDFFKYIVMPAAKDAKLADKTPSEQIAALLARSTVELFVDSPARNYLKYGGATAEAFFTACVDMARTFLQSHTLPSSLSPELPKHVVDAFRAYVEETEQVTAGQKRLRPPRLLLDPYSHKELHRLELPAQPIDVDRARWRYEWKMCLVGATTRNCAQVEKVRVRRIGYDLTTEPRTVSLEFPPGQVCVELWATSAEEDKAVQPELVGRWVVSLAPPSGQAPLLAFQAQSGQAIRTDRTLPAERLWLLYPRTAQLKPIGEGHCTQRIAELLGDWSDWQIEEWDLSRATAIIVEALGDTWSFVVRSQLQEPRLEGGRRLLEVVNEEDVPFFVDELPRLWLPRLNNQSRDDELKDWRVAVCSRWAAVPALPESSPRPLSDWRHAVTVQTESVEFPLSAILGAAPIGLYEITVEGPHKVRKSMRFSVWQRITINNWQPVYLPGPHGAETVTFSLCTASAHQVTVQPGAEGITVTYNAEEGCYAVTVASTASEAPLFLEAPRAQGETVRVALHVRIARLRWKVTTDEDVIEWSTTPLHLPADKLIQSRSPHLLLELDAEDWPACRLLLQDAGATAEPLQMSDWRKPQRGQRRMHLPLAEYSETLRQLMDYPVFTFSLELHSESTNPGFLPLLYLNREPELTVVLLDWAPDGVTYLHWEAEHRLRNRRVRLWSAWQPWVPPYEFCIPDDVAATELSKKPGSGMLQLPIKLPRGWYRVALRTAPAWEELSAPPEPPAGALLARDADPDFRLLELEDADPTSPEQEYLSHFERACILDAMNDNAGCQAEVQWLFKHHAQAAPDMLYSVYRWLHARNDPTARAIRLHMFALDKVERVLFEDKFASLRRSYMEAFAEIRFVKPECALLVLQSSQIPELDSHALQILLKHQRPEAVSHILGRVSQGALSEQDAVALFSVEEWAEFSLQTLLRQPTAPVRDRIILRLLSLTPTASLVRLGDWVHCEAGWGKIETISLGGESRSWFDPEHEMPKLGIVLRPNLNPLRIVLHVHSRKMVFPEHSRLYRCTKDNGCAGFISIWQDDVTYQHNRVAHDGMQPAFEQIGAHEWRWRKAPTYHRQPPDNEFQ